MLLSPGSRDAGSIRVRIGTTREQPHDERVLVERDDAILAVSRCLDGASAGFGRIVVLQGPAGTGKTALLAVAQAHALSRGMQVLSATGGALERDFPFAAMMQLFETPWMHASRDERARLTAGPADLAGAMLDGRIRRGHAPTDHGYHAVRSLFWLVCNWVSRGPLPGDAAPLALLIDDAQWVDQPSLRFLAYLASRLAELPVALVIAHRPGEAVDLSALNGLHRLPAAAMLRLDPLTVDGTARAVLSAFTGADSAFVAACFAATAGNPFLIAELLWQIRADDARPDARTVEQLTEAPPRAILDAVVERLERRPDPVRAVAHAVAVLGDAVPLKRAARLAELEPRAAADAADALVELNLLAPQLPLSFVSPVIRSAGHPLSGARLDVGARTRPRTPPRRTDSARACRTAAGDRRASAGRADRG
jgi:hypothetical protein